MTTTARIIADSLSEHGDRLITVQVKYPKMIHGEVLTHRKFSRNASSSRAIPVGRLVQDVIDDPVMPVYWGKNKPGMQASEELDDKELIYTGKDGTPVSELTIAKQIWLVSRDLAAKQALALAKIGAHKQIVNRLIEPFCHINVLITSTDWANFFALRRHADAQPEIHELADVIFSVITSSEPKRLAAGQWHLPYVDQGERGTDVTALRQMAGGSLGPSEVAWVQDSLIKLSVARCARVSYLTHDLRVPKVGEDLHLYDRLVGSVPAHASPCEHQARPDTFLNGSWSNPHLHGNFLGWVQFRKTLPNERVLDR